MLEIRPMTFGVADAWARLSADLTAARIVAMVSRRKPTMTFERVGVEILRDHVKDITARVTDQGVAVVLTRYGQDIGALVPLEFLLLCEEADLLSEASVVARAHFLDDRRRCKKCGKKSPPDSTPLFGAWHFPNCSRYRAPAGLEG